MAYFGHYYFASFGLTIDPQGKILTQTLAEGLFRQPGRRTATSEENLLNQRMLKARVKMLRKNGGNGQGNALCFLRDHKTFLEIRA